MCINAVKSAPESASAERLARALLVQVVQVQLLAAEHPEVNDDDAGDGASHHLSKVHGEEQGEVQEVTDSACTVQGLRLNKQKGGALYSACGQAWPTHWKLFSALRGHHSCSCWPHPVAVQEGCHEAGLAAERPPGADGNCGDDTHVAAPPTYRTGRGQQQLDEGAQNGVVRDERVDAECLQQG